MNDKIILICAIGRSGSTTMQRILNTNPNSNICGENMGAVNSLLEFYKRIKITTFEYVPGHKIPFTLNYLVKKNVKPSWYNSYNYDEIVNNIKQMIIRLFKLNEQTNIWGFKEIRYEGNNLKYLHEFKELFPQTKVILQIRENIEVQSNSGWFKDNKISAKNYLIKCNNSIIDFYNKNRDFCYLMTFEKMFDLNNIKKMFIFLDCEENYDSFKIQEILNNNILIINYFFRFFLTCTFKFGLSFFGYF